MTDRPILLEGLVAVPPPRPTVAPVVPPRPAAVAVDVPEPVRVAVEIPAPVSVAVARPRPTFVGIPMPAWIRELLGWLQGQGAVTAEPTAIRLIVSAQIRGYGTVTAAPVMLEMKPSTRTLGGRGRVSAVNPMFSLPAGLRTLGGRGRVAATLGAMILPAGLRTLGGRGRVDADAQAMGMDAGPAWLRGRGTVGYRESTIGMDLVASAVQWLRGRGEITATLGPMILPAGSRALAGRGELVATSVVPEMDVGVVDLLGLGEIVAVDPVITQIAFQQAGSAARSNSAATVVMTTPGPATLILACVTNTWSGASVQVNGSTPTLLGTRGTLRLYTANVEAGEHTITHTGGGSWRTIAVGAYIGVTSVSEATMDNGSGSTATITPAGAGVMAVAGFSGSSVDSSSTTSNGDLRVQQSGVSSPYDVALADRLAAPVELYQSSSASWNAIAVWLS